MTMMRVPYFRISTSVRRCPGPSMHYKGRMVYDARLRYPQMNVSFPRIRHSGTGRSWATSIRYGEGRKPYYGTERLLRIVLKAALMLSEQ